MFFTYLFNVKMKFRNTLIVAFGLLTTWLFLTSSNVNPSNPPTGVTGAPSETTCQQSGCHGGGSYTGTVTLTGIPDSITANTSYSITLTQASNAVRGGFELTCLDGSNVKCGTLTAGSGSSVATSGGRQYARQSSVKTLSSGSVSWTFTWKSPATSSGNIAKFYFVSLAANGNGGTSGDKALTGNKTVVIKQVSPTVEPVAEDWVRVYRGGNNLSINLLQDAYGMVTVFDLSGKLVTQQVLTSDNQLDLSSWPAGICIANIQAGGKSVTKKFFTK